MSRSSFCADERVLENTAIEPDQPVDAIEPESYTLPAGFQWDTLNIGDPLILKELYTLLNENYVEDDDAMFRFDYSPNFLKWLNTSYCLHDEKYMYTCMFLPLLYSISWDWWILRSLQSPGWLKEWHVGVRAAKTGQLVGFISAIPATLSIYNV